MVSLVPFAGIGSIGSTFAGGDGGVAGVFRAWWFEPLIATLSFAFAIHVYWYEERKRGLSRDNNLLDTFVLQTSDLWNSLGAYWIGISILKVLGCILNTSEIITPDGFPTDLGSFFYLFSAAFLQ